MLCNAMCKEVIKMATNLTLDDKLIDEVLRIGKYKTKKEAVTAALKEYIITRKQKKIKNLFGLIEYDSDYNYKKRHTVT